MDRRLDRACDHRSLAMCGHFRGNWSTTSNSNQYQSNQYQTETDQLGQSLKSNPGIREYDWICRVDPINRQLVDGYTRLVIDRVDRGWSCHLITFQFSQLPGLRGAVIQAMKDELHRVYSTFVTRTNRKPRSASPDDLPILIGTADLQVYQPNSCRLMCRFSDAGMTRLSTRCGGRRPKSAKARKRGKRAPAVPRAFMEI
jgi:hypothetical protein